jgi:hypothetical protein
MNAIYGYKDVISSPFKVCSADFDDVRKQESSWAARVGKISPDGLTAELQGLEALQNGASRIYSPAFLAVIFGAFFILI